MNHDSFKSLIAVLTAIVTVLGATAACLASVAVSNAGDADFAGLDASIRAQKAEIINQVTAFEHYRAFTSYMRYNELGNLMFDSEANAETDSRNTQTRQEVWGIASGLSSTFFSPRYITAEGAYDIERELQEEFARDAQDEDLNATPYFDYSDQQRKQSAYLSGTMIWLAVSFWFFTLAQTTEKKIKYLWAAVGVLAGMAGIVGILIGRFRI